LNILLLLVVAQDREALEELVAVLVDLELVLV
jgi:hypothetical protein